MLGKRRRVFEPIKTRGVSIPLSTKMNAIILVAATLIATASAVQGASSTLGIKIRWGEDRRAKVTIVPMDPRNILTDLSIEEASKILKEWAGTGSKVGVGIVADPMISLRGYLPLLDAISKNSDLRLIFIDGAPTHPDWVPGNIRKRIEQAGTGQPATRPESKSEGGDKPQPESESRSR